MGGPWQKEQKIRYMCSAGPDKNLTAMLACRKNGGRGTHGYGCFRGGNCGSHIPAWQRGSALFHAMTDSTLCRACVTCYDSSLEQEGMHTTICNVTKTPAGPSQLNRDQNIQLIWCQGPRQSHCAVSTLSTYKRYFGDVDVSKSQP
jgi:hypothetical protein